MEHLLNIIQTRIQQGMPELPLVDEDYGQFENQDATCPMAYPAVLISAPEINWLGEAPVQQGKCTITTRLVIDCCNGNNEADPGLEEKMAVRQQMAAKLNALLHTFRVPEMGTLIREQSKSYTYKNGVKIYETQYRVLVIDRR